MTQFGVDCHDFPQALLAGQENEKTVLYKVLCRERLTDKMKDLMRQLAQRPTIVNPMAKENFPRPQLDGRTALSLGTLMGRAPIPGRRMSRPGPVPTAVVNNRGPIIGGPKIPGRVTGPPGPSPMKLSRPVAIRKPLQVRREEPNSHLI
jgi:hypothetical protein